MTAQVFEVLSEGGAEKAERLRIARIPLLRELLNQTEADPDHREQWACLCKVLRQRIGRDVLKQGSPFFWKHLASAVASGVCGSNDLSSSMNYLLGAAYDSYWRWLPRTSSWVIRSDDGIIVLPGLHLRIQTKGGEVKARRAGGGSLEFQTDNTTLVVSSDDLPAPLRMRAIKIPGFEQSELLLVKHRSLFEDAYIDSIVPNTPRVDVLARLIGKSLEMITAADPGLAARIVSTIRWYVPIFSPGAHTHNSFSVRGLTGVIFLSEAYEDIRLAEALVHEFHHSELYLLQEAEQVYKSDPEARFYSPWRPDPRPFDGLLHALHVFSSCCAFLGRLEGLPQLAGYGQSIRRRRVELAQQLRLGLAQVPREILLPLGEDIINAVCADVEKFERALAMASVRLAPPLQQHMRKWREENPELVDRLRVPEGVTIGT